MELLKAEKDYKERSAKVPPETHSGPKPKHEQELDFALHIDEKYGRILWKDVEQITGGNSDVTESKLDLNAFMKFPSLGPKKSPTDADSAEDDDNELLGATNEGLDKKEYILEQFRSNKWFREKFLEHKSEIEETVNKKTDMEKKYKKMALAYFNKNPACMAYNQIEQEKAMNRMGEGTSADRSGTSGMDKTPRKMSTVTAKGLDG